MKKAIYHSLGFLNWFVGFTKLFVFDIDLFLIESYAPSLGLIINYRLVIILSLVVISWLILGNDEFLKLFFFVLFYPVILLLWTIPTGLLIRKNWFWIFTYISGFISTITNFKKNLILITVFLISTSFILNSNNQLVIYASGALLLFISLFIIARKAYFAFSPSAIFAINTKTIVNYLEKNSLGQYLLENNSEKEEESNEELVTEIEKTEQDDEIPEKVPLLILTNRTLYFIAEKLKRFKESRVYVVFFIISLLFTFAVSVVLFSLINYGIYKLDPASFSMSGYEGYFIFLYYSFNALIMNSISAVEPLSFLSMTINMVQIFYGIVLIVILIGIIISVNTQKYKDDIDQVIYAFDMQSEDVEKILELNFKMSIHQAINELERVKHSLIDFIKFIDPEQK